ncbi:hypothetical protein BHE74_00028153 [Ensete ventricosum]|nr:hypothetical protein BHE74_00028153 [Ensete ventricosum]RZS25415.1 hypothetical protein BHM03_00058612 [Ensete ventricosum]
MGARDVLINSMTAWELVPAVADARGAKIYPLEKRLQRLDAPPHCMSDQAGPGLVSPGPSFRHFTHPWLNCARIYRLLLDTQHKTCRQSRPPAAVAAAAAAAAAAEVEVQ